MIFNINELKTFLNTRQPEKYLLIEQMINITINCGMNLDKFKMVSINGYNINEHQSYVLYVIINIDDYSMFIRKLKIKQLL